MHRMSVLWLYIVTLIAFVGIDFVWLTMVAQTFYQQQIGFLLKSEPNIWAAFLLYVLFTAGLLYFVVLPALKYRYTHIATVLLSGALFGFVTYAAYDLTNLATISNWPLPFVMVDLLWGTILTATIAAISFKVGRHLTK